ncbi:MAG: FAD-dependent oxidoreductase [Alphaproteobacteria bacterium]|jgi:2-polyprenyl-6-methoxyphenol hydroxylase-like FAD-dependent oxidoreductase|nr:FAD-dependent oxidoreductase [Alphaproteobacteria bacterium]MBN9577990.1 FAD-dependent oxidoreductase [Alphaproteobacteria bacterium]
MTDASHRDHPESILVSGCGIAGLGLALAFGGSAHPVTILDRDPPPPDGSPEDVFATWERRGATQLRHSHVFLGRLTTLIRTRYPALMDELFREGARVLCFKDGLSPALKPVYTPAPGDEDLQILFSRRTTLESVIRRFVTRFDNIRFVTDAGVRGLVLQRDASAIRATGLNVEMDGQTQTLSADIVVDASGRNTNFPDWLRAEGVEVSEEHSPAGILYFTRHYRLRDGMEEPPRDLAPLGGDLGYIKYAVFPADNRHFSITLATPDIETNLRTAIMRPEIFQGLCENLIGCKAWVADEISVPVSAIYAMGNLESLWRSYLRGGEAQVLNFFAVGDAAVRTNPLYGRGCSTGMVHAHLLKTVLDEIHDPRQRAIVLEQRTHAALRPFYDAMVHQDRAAIRRARYERNPQHRPRLRARVTQNFVENGIGPATRGNMDVARAFSRAFHMIDDPSGWLKRPDTLMTILSYWARPKAWKQANGLYPPVLGPSRQEMLSKLGLPA